MGLLQFVGDFLFGKAPDIFDDKGNVVHKFPKKKWEDWNNRLKNDPAYNWRHHTGASAGRKANPTKPSK